MRKIRKLYPAWFPVPAGLILFLYFSIPQFPISQALQATSAPTSAAPSGLATSSPTPQATPTATQLSIPTVGSSILRPSATPTGQGNSIGGSSSEVIIATATGQPAQPIPVTGSGSSSNCFLGASLILAFVAGLWTLAKMLPR